MSDLVERQAAIDAFERFIHELGIDDEPYNYGEMALSKDNVPSTQPEKVKCKKCRYVYYDKEFGNYWCNRMSDSFMVEEDGYCKWGK